MELDSYRQIDSVENRIEKQLDHFISAFMWFNGGPDDEETLGDNDDERKMDGIFQLFSGG